MNDLARYQEIGFATVSPTTEKLRTKLQQQSSIEIPWETFCDIHTYFSTHMKSEQDTYMASPYKLEDLITIKVPQDNQYATQSGSLESHQQIYLLPRTRAVNVSILEVCVRSVPAVNVSTRVVDKLV
jgi:hypothetical protein